MSRDTDDYAKKFMAGESALGSSRVRMPGWFFGLMGGLALLTLVAGIATLATAGLAGLVPILFSLPLLVVVTLLFSHVRVTVSAAQLVVQYGLFGPKVPLERITHVSAEAYDWKKFGGWGIKWSRDGTTAYSVPGGNGRVVRVHYLDPKGKEKKVVVSVDDADGMAAAIQLARAGRTAGTGVRVAAEPPAEVDDAVDADAADERLRRQR
ncbi:MAG: hypothetical protein IT373_26960 [Polyangiaceae bacterium]|nr:hypothetical protein [Polyangiaceae bacterium]